MGDGDVMRESPARCGRLGGSMSACPQDNSCYVIV